MPQDKIDKAIDIVTDMANNATGAFHEILRVFGENLGEMLWNTEDVQSALEALEGVDEGIKVYTTNFEEGRYADIDTMLNEDRLDEVIPALAVLGRGVGGLGLKYLQRHAPKLARTVKNAWSKAKGKAKGKDGADKAKDGAKAKSVGATAGGMAKRAIKWVGKNPIKSYLGYNAINAMTSDERDLINDAEQGIDVDFDELQKVIDKYKAIGLGESNELSRIKHLAGIEEGFSLWSKDDDDDDDEGGLFGGYKTRQDQLDAQEAEAMGLAKPKKKDEDEVEEGYDMDAHADPELDYEGDMAKNQLARIMLHAEHLSSMLEDNENMPEWVQSKITKALDYIATAHDYLMGEEYKD